MREKTEKQPSTRDPEILRVGNKGLHKLNDASNDFASSGNISKAIKSRNKLHLIAEKSTQVMQEKH